MLLYSFLVLWIWMFWLFVSFFLFAGLRALFAGRFLSAIG